MCMCHIWPCMQMCMSLCVLVSNVYISSCTPCYKSWINRDWHFVWLWLKRMCLSVSITVVVMTVDCDSLMMAFLSPYCSLYICWLWHAGRWHNTAHIWKRCSTNQKQYIYIYIKDSDFVQNFAEKTQVLLCSANAWIGTHTTFLVIPRQCCHFSVVQSFQFEITTHLTGQTFAINWSKIQLSWVLMLYYPYKTMFSVYKSVIVTPCACDLFVSKVTKITRYMDVHFFQCVMTVSWNQPQPGCWSYLYCIFIHSCTYTTQRFK